MSTVAELPTWDLNVYFNGPSDPELLKNIQTFAQLVENLGRSILTFEDGAESLAQLIALRNEAEAQFEFLSSYVGCAIAADTSNSDFQARQSELDLHNVKFVNHCSQMARLVGASSADFDHPLLADHKFVLGKMKILSQHLMSPKEEELAAELALSGSRAWENLTSNYSSQILVSVEGFSEQLPMSSVRALAFDPNAVTRRRAYDAELSAWKDCQTTLCACINNIKGEVETLRQKRGWGSALDIALFECNIGRDSLEAMLSAARESFPDFRRYLKAKNRLISGNNSPLPWFDLFAPVGDSSSEWTYSQACEFVASTFDSYSEKMGDFARRTYKENWHDVPPRAGKVDGAFCAGTRGDESRILLNFKEAFGSVATLAHELGHAYHNLCLAGRTAMQRHTPMTLAETASIFCETLCRRAGLTHGSADDQLAILEMSLQGACQQVVDITSRYLFESTVFEKRAQREVSAGELCEAMALAQEATYGDGLDPQYRHAYMWAAKPHYYSTHSYYNFPYMYGLLFALGLFARYEADRDSFRNAYDDLLASTGMADATQLGELFGININGIEFWRASLDVIRSDIDRFEALANAH